MTKDEFIIECKKTGSLGEKFGEGFGMYKIYKYQKSTKWDIKDATLNGNDDSNADDTDQKTKTSEQNEPPKMTPITPLLKSIFEKRLKTEILKYINDNIKKTQESCKLGATTIGRLTLMLEE